MRPERRFKPGMDGGLTAAVLVSPPLHLRTPEILSKRWGPPHTYKASLERVISLNLLCRSVQKSQKNDTDEFGSDYQRRFFPWDIRIDFNALAFDQEDEEDVYFVLLIAQILALQSADRRWDKGWRRMLPEFYQALDKLSLYGRDAVQDILRRVIPGALASLGSEAIDWAARSGRPGGSMDSRPVERRPGRWVRAVVET